MAVPGLRSTACPYRNLFGGEQVGEDESVSRDDFAALDLEVEVVDGGEGGRE